MCFCRTTIIFEQQLYVFKINAGYVHQLKLVLIKCTFFILTVFKKIYNIVAGRHLRADFRFKNLLYVVTTVLFIIIVTYDNMMLIQRKFVTYLSSCAFHADRIIKRHYNKHYYEVVVGESITTRYACLEFQLFFFFNSTNEYF